MYKKSTMGYIIIDVDMTFFIRIRQGVGVVGWVIKTEGYRLNPMNTNQTRLLPTSGKGAVAS